MKTNEDIALQIFEILQKSVTAARLCWGIPSLNLNVLPSNLISLLISVNPFTATILDGVFWGDSNFLVCGREILWCDHSNESSLPVLTHGDICYSKFHKMKFENLVEICFWLNLAVKGLRNSFWQYRWIFPNWPAPNVKKNRRRVHCKELVQNISTYFQRQKLEWTANTTTVQAPPLLLVDQRLRLSLYCWDRSVLSLVPYLN